MRPLTAAGQRRLERAMHLLAGLILLTYVYVPPAVSSETSSASPSSPCSR